MTSWILAQPAAWRARISAVTIGMSTTYKAVARAALPHAQLAVDPFHTAQLGNKAVSDVRRRVSHQLRHRRGRATDPEYTIKDRLLWGPDALSDRGRRRILETFTVLEDLDGEAAHALRTAWNAKNLLLDLLALSPARTGVATTPHRHRQGPDQVSRLLRDLRKGRPRGRHPCREDLRLARRDRHRDPPRTLQRRRGRQPGHQARLPHRLRPAQRPEPAAPRQLRHHPK